MVANVINMYNDGMEPKTIAELTRVKLSIVLRLIEWSINSSKGYTK